MKKKLMRFNLAALALVMVTSVLISGTFAKYTTAVSAQDTALIARWDISSAGMEATTAEMDLFGHAYNVAIQNNDEGTPILGPGVEDKFTVNLKGTADVDATIDLRIEKTDGAVGAPIQYAVTKEGEAVNWETATIYYSEHYLAEAILNQMAAIADNDMIVANESASKVAAGATTPGEKAIVLKNSEDTTNVNVDVHWRWPFDATVHDTAKLTAVGITGTGTAGAWTDADDTTLGKASADAGTRTSYGLKLTLTAEQITPEVPTP